MVSRNALRKGQGSKALQEEVPKRLRLPGDISHLHKRALCSASTFTKQLPAQQINGACTVPVGCGTAENRQLQDVSLDF